MRYDEAFLSNFGPAFHQGWQSADLARRDANHAEQRQREREEDAAALEKRTADMLAERRGEREAEARLSAEADRLRRKEVRDRLALEDAAEKRRAAAQAGALRMEEAKLDAAIFEKKTGEYEEALSGLSNLTPEILANRGAALLRKQATGAKLTLDEAAQLQAGMRLAARLRAPQTEKVFENLYKVNEKGEKEKGEDGKFIILGRKEYVQRRQPETPEPAKPESERMKDGSRDWEATNRNDYLDRARRRAELIYGAPPPAPVTGAAPTAATPRTAGALARVGVLSELEAAEAARKKAAAAEAARQAEAEERIRVQKTIPNLTSRPPGRYAW